MTETEQRAAVVAEAFTWVGTRFHKGARLKCRRDGYGRVIDPGGVDCGQLIWAVFHACGLAPFVPLESDRLERSVEDYAGLFEGRARPVAAPLPGDIFLCPIGRRTSHGGIVIAPGWPAIVHASARPRLVLRDRADRFGAAVAFRFFSVW